MEDAAHSIQVEGAGVLLQEPPPAHADTGELPAVVAYSFADDGSDDCVQARAVPTPGENSDVHGTSFAWARPSEAYYAPGGDGGAAAAAAGAAVGAARIPGRAAERATRAVLSPGCPPAAPSPPAATKARSRSRSSASIRLPSASNSRPALGHPQLRLHHDERVRLDEHLAQRHLGPDGAAVSARRPHDADGLPAQDAVLRGARGPVDGVLEHARYGVVVLRGGDEQGVGRHDAPLQVLAPAAGRPRPARRRCTTGCRRA